MARINCPKCSTEVSDTALRCPKCGVRLTKSKRDFGGALFKWIIGFIILMVFWFLFGTKSIMGFLSTLGGIIFLAMIVGLIKPSILRMPSLSSRLRVFGVGAFSLIVLAFIQESFEPQPTQDGKRSVEIEKTEISDSESKSDVKEAEERKERIETGKLREAEELRRRTKDPTYVSDLRAALKEGKKLISEAESALKARNYNLAKSLLDSVGENLYRRHKVYYNPKGWLEDNWSKPYSWFHPEEKQAYNQYFQAARLSKVVRFREAEAEFEDSGALSTKRGSFERLVELAILWKFRPSEEGQIYRLGLEEIRIVDGKEMLDGVTLIKNIDFTDGRLTVSLRAGVDSYNSNIFGDRKITLTHPVNTMKESHDFIWGLFNEDSSSYYFPKEFRKDFNKINEVILALYFPGKGSGEIVIARYGIKRTKFDRKKWKKLRAKDGTFQDYLKTHGTYYLHRDMPDKGTPAHILKG